MDFAAIDVETANSDVASICQIGIAHYSQGELVSEYCAYIDPQARFAPVNISIHGISEETVAGAPAMNEAAAVLHDLLDDRIVVCHTRFDRIAITKALEKHGIRPPRSTWLDSALVARRAWSEFSKGGYGLKNVCRTLRYDFKHHDALEDAKACAYILLAAAKECNLDMEGLFKRVGQPVAVRPPLEGGARLK